MDRRTKAALNRDKATRLMSAWNKPVAQARYSDDGHWYALLEHFPAALVDSNGYLLFETIEHFRTSPHITVGKQVSVKAPGISAVPGYVRMTSPEEIFSDDIDIHEFLGSEGRQRLLLHLSRERDRRLVLKKKNASQSLVCEVCGFSFLSAYGELAANYCEVHHLIPLSESEQKRKTLLKDLSILCANCHRVVHLRNPPFTIQEVKAMLKISR
jgi:hypothetical protein